MTSPPQNSYLILIERIRNHNHHHRVHWYGNKLLFKVIKEESSNEESQEGHSKQQLGSFELLEDSIQNVVITPTSKHPFHIQCCKSNNASPSFFFGGEAESSASIQVIHQRNDPTILLHHDSNENITTVYLPQDKNFISKNASTLSSFQSKNNEQKAESSTTDSSGCASISSRDLQRFCRFECRLSPIKLDLGTAEMSEDTVPPPPTTNDDEDSSSEHSSNDSATSHHELIASTSSSSPQNAGAADAVQFHTTFDNAIDILIELKNLTTTTTTITKPHPLSLQPTTPPTATTHDPTSSSHHHEKLTEYNKSSMTKVYALKKFIKAIVKHRLQFLGVQHLDCNEIIDSWEHKTKNIFQDPTPTTTTTTSPFMSKPNSALFNFSPSGYVTKSIFSTFVTQVDSLKSIMNDATCNLIHISVDLLLPEIKLLWGRQLDSNRNPVFISEWLRLISLAATSLEPSAPEEIILMVNREMKRLKKASRKLHRHAKRFQKKIQDLNKTCEEVFRKTLAILNPKSLKKLDIFNKNLENLSSSDCIHFDPDFLNRIDVLKSELFKDHVFLSQSEDGLLIIKTDIEDNNWEKYSSLDFSHRRGVFLAMTEDLHKSMSKSLEIMHQLQEIYTSGYPGSIKNVLTEIVEELKYTSRRDDLTLLIKTSIVTHVTCLHEMLTRLVYIAREVKGLTKQFREQSMGGFDLRRLKSGNKKKDQQQEEERIGFDALRGYQQQQQSRGPNVKLAIPYSGGGGLY